MNSGPSPLNHRSEPRMSSEPRLDVDPVTSSPQPGPGAPGQALVEFALVLTALLFLMVVAVDVGRLFYEYEAMVAGADAAAIWMEDNRKYKYTYDCTAGNADAAAKQVARDHSGQVVATSEVGLSWTGTAWAGASQYTVTITHNFTALTPLAETALKAAGGPLTMTYSARGKHRGASTYTCP